jgi:penicillin-binding protein 1A
MWKQIMAVAHKDLPKAQFVKPEGIVGPIQVCIDSGKLPTELCKQDPRGHRIRSEYFIRGTQPSDHCDVHVEDFIDTSTGLLATEHCPMELVERRVFIKRPVPYTPSPTGQIPLDAAYELPTEYCAEHEFAPVITLPDDEDQEQPDDFEGPNGRDQHNGGHGFGNDNWSDNWQSGNDRNSYNNNGQW